MVSQWVVLKSSAAYANECQMISSFKCASQNKEREQGTKAMYNSNAGSCFTFPVLCVLLEIMEFLSGRAQKRKWKEEKLIRKLEKEKRNREEDAKRIRLQEEEQHNSKGNFTETENLQVFSEKKATK